MIADEGHGCGAPTYRHALLPDARHRVPAIGGDPNEASWEASRHVGETMAKARQTLVQRFGVPGSPQAFIGSVRERAPANVTERMAVQHGLSSLPDRQRFLAGCPVKLEVAKRLGPAIKTPTRAVFFSWRKGAVCEVEEHAS